MNVLELEGVTKKYGDRYGVRDLSLSVPEGSIYGLLGPNGAGKTTTLRVIMGIVLPDSGKVMFESRPLGPDERRMIGYLPEERGLYRRMKVLDQLVFFATVRGVPPKEAKKRAMAWLERFGLADRAGSKVETLSKGMQQKVQFIGCIIHRPKLLILDEPFSGLDPIVTKELKDLLKQMASDGMAILLSTHVLPQVEELCDHICLINNSRAVLSGRLDEIRQSFAGNLWTVEGEFRREELERVDGVVSAEDLNGGKWLVRLAEGEKPAKLASELAATGRLVGLSRFVPTLESIFIEAVRRGGSDA